MSEISRRDFLNGAALAIAAGLTPAAQIAAQPARYPPALTGLRGQHAGSFEAAHAFVRERERFAVDRLRARGALRSGRGRRRHQRARGGLVLSPRHGPQARILVLDNHDDFGGHAKRNEFMVDGRLMIGYGGSQSIDSPQTHWSDVAKGLLRDLGVDVTRFETAFEREALFVARAFARPVPAARALRARRAGARAIRSRIPATQSRARSPMRGRLPSSSPICRSPRRASGSCSRSMTRTRDPLAGKTVEEKLSILKHTSYRDYLIKICGCSEEVANCFQGRTYGFFGLGCDAVPAADVRDMGYPGFARPRACQTPARAAASPTSIISPTATRRWRGCWCARLFRASRPASTMEDVVLAPFDYGRLDSRRNVRIRLDSTCVDVRNASGKVLDRLYARRRDPSRRGEPRRARLLPHDDPASDARACRARSARRWRRTSRRRSSTPMWWCATGGPGRR